MTRLKHKGKIFIISGPSGSGKTTLHKRLLLSGRLKGKLIKSISATTRKRRPDERHGRDYLFFTARDFLAKKERGYFLEWQRVFDHYYGTPKGAVKRILQNGKNVLLCIDVKGARVVEKSFPDCVKIFITVPSPAVLRTRLQRRASESNKELAHRLEVSRREMKEAGRYDYIVSNDVVHRAVKKLESIVVSELRNE